MASIIPLPLGPAGLAHPGSRAGGPRGGVAGWLLAAVAAVIRRERTLRELRRLDDRQLRDIGLDRMDVADPSHVTVAWDAGTGIWLRSSAPGP